MKLEEICKRVLADNVDLKTAYKSGKYSSLGTLAGYVMKEARYKFNASEVIKKLRELMA
jgi:Asp-tRNA(Asn)/Glu-tRNA(Gln) amidotransferase B subunit